MELKKELEERLSQKLKLKITVDNVELNKLKKELDLIELQVDNILQKLKLIDNFYSDFIN